MCVWYREPGTRLSVAHSCLQILGVHPRRSSGSGTSGQVFQPVLPLFEAQTAAAEPEAEGAAVVVRHTPPAAAIQRQASRRFRASFFLRHLSSRGDAGAPSLHALRPQPLFELVWYGRFWILGGHTH